MAVVREHRRHCGRVRPAPPRPRGKTPHKLRSARGDTRWAPSFVARVRVLSAPTTSRWPSIGSGKGHFSEGHRASCNPFNAGTDYLKLHPPPGCSPDDPLEDVHRRFRRPAGRLRIAKKKETQGLAGPLVADCTRAQRASRALHPDDFRKIENRPEHYFPA